MSQQITCPSCGTHIDLDKIANEKFESEQIKMREAFEKEKEKEREEMRKKASEFAKKKAEEAKKEMEMEMKDKNEQLEKLQKERDESRKKELEFLKKEAQYNEMKKNIDFEKEKARLDERKKMEANYSKQTEERIRLEIEKTKLEHEKQLRAKDEQMAQMKRSIDDAKRKGEQGSMQIQGELLEDAIKEILQANFPLDTVSDVEKGIKGADLIQEVCDASMPGKKAGTIAWETKNTKTWSDLWVEKIKEDRLRVGADICIIASETLPNEITSFGLYRDIWVVKYDFVLPLATAIRSHLIEISKTRNSLKGKDEKMEIIYNYLISSEFKAKIENIIDAFNTMKNDLESEKRSFERIWNKREKQLTRVISNTAGLYGDMQGLIGSSLQSVGYLELEGGH